MNRRLATFFILLVLLLPLSCTMGCVSVRTADTRNVTVAVESYNAWVSEQKGFDREVRDIIALLGDHINTYNAEIAKDQPDYSMLRENLEKDRQLLDRWGSDLENLNTATGRFEESTDQLMADSVSGPRTGKTPGLLTQYMKIYMTDIGNARQHLIEYVNNAEVYIEPEDPDYWNDNYRQAAMQAKEQAATALVDGDAALENITLYARQLENFQ
jgi:hypothetical protein